MRIFAANKDDNHHEPDKNVCVYSASSTKIESVYFEAAEELGRLLASRQINLINGAGCLGLMCRISDAALAAGGTVTGVIPGSW